MTATIDRFFIARGVNEAELLALEARTIVYAGVALMAGLSTCLLAGIIANVVG